MLNSRSFYYTLRVLPYFMLIEALSLLIPSLYESFRLGPIGDRCVGTNNISGCGKREALYHARGSFF
ncbi:transmembrane protein, putative [Medicago truncatula]|uniref:Transmembrane protein, putative n=1 Tax=Medicago truncatula TaxID=3880 RepID=G7IXY7_MEDTR|nr:transmembrane protein, putative [Medicago truncatula]